MDYLMINTYLELNNLDENDIYKYSNKYYKIALAFYTSFHYLMKVNVKSIKNITYGTNVNNEILKKLFNIENCNIEEYYKKIIKSIDINVLLNSDSVKDYNEKLIIIETLNVKDDINIKKIIPFSYYFVIYDDKHINELLVYFEYKNEIYFYKAKINYNINFIDKKALIKVKKTAYIINTSRGEVLDEDFLLQMIEEGKIAGAALDVLSKEFSGKADWILNSKILESKELGKKILITPHIGGATRESINKTDTFVAKKFANHIKC
jgi:hypothetical protein